MDEIKRKVALIVMPKFRDMYLRLTYVTNSMN